MIIEKLDNKGRGITYIDNKITFISNALPGEDVEIENLIINKKYNEAKVKKIKNKSKYRVNPKCPYYGICGGCNLGHMVLPYQEEFKLNKVKEILKKYADVDINIKFLPSDKDLFYRNKVTLKMVDGKLGYYAEETHTICEIDKCLLANNEINLLLSKIKFNNFLNGEITIRVNYENKILLSIITNDDIKVDYSNLDNIEGIIINNKTIYKNNYFYDYIDDLKFKISYNSFFQVNNYVASLIFNILRNNLSGKNLLDLYCGVGTLGLSLKEQYKNICGIEKIENAIKDAKENAKINGITNAKYYVGDTAKIINKINMKFDTVIVDPPRSGLNETTINEILKINPKKICYISCDPMTLARDLRILKEKYKISKIYALDMFPNTYHVECVCILNSR